MANPQPDEYTRISNELYAAIMQRDFTKRQRNIIDLVIRMSYGCGMKTALLRPSDFSVVGVQKQHIRIELKQLAEANVLVISGNEIMLNKDYERWDISKVKGYDEDKFKNILRSNLEFKIFKLKQNVDDSYQNGNQVTETVTEESYQFSNRVTETVTNDSYQISNQVTETVTDSKEEQTFGYQNSNKEVTETVTTTPLNPLCDVASKTPKESIKEITTTTNTINQSDYSEVLNEEKYIESIDEKMSQRLGKPYMIQSNNLRLALELFRNHVPLQTVIQGIDESFDGHKGSGVKSFAYCVPKINDIHKRYLDLQNTAVRSKTITSAPFGRTNQSDKYDVFYQLYEQRQEAAPT